ncbi:hypothetical protein WME75_45570 [Sorangium sp. So ce1014]|uniref:hypothetical protein n=1 Tax=Sorangium sp. So ce1014 TaxID=3133326 RepID=UPI003F5E3B69
MNVTELARDAILSASCKFAQVAERYLEGGAPADANQAVRLLEASVMAFKVCVALDESAAGAAQKQRPEPFDLSTKEGWARAADSFR